MEDDMTEMRRIGIRDDRIKRLEDTLIELAMAVAKGTSQGIDAIRAYRIASDKSLSESKAWYDTVRVDRSEPAPTELSLIRSRLEKVEKWQAAVDAAVGRLCATS